MNLVRFFFASSLLVVALGSASHPAAAARRCIFSWAVPGTYVITGEYRGSVQSANIYLTNNCKLIIPLPGVFTGGQLVRAGQCLKFNLKVEHMKKAVTAHWCNTYGTVPLGKHIFRASVKRKLAPSDRGWKKKQNFNRKPITGS